jgi:CcmD family protein
MRGLSVLLAVCVSFGVARAQDAGSAAPAAGSAAPAVSSAEARALRKTCVDAMNADPSFASEIVQTAVMKGTGSPTNTFCADVDTIETHRNAVMHVQKNERHVIGAYAAMWVIAALFLLYLFRRQQRLRAEIDQLRRELDAAAKDGKDGK